MYKYIYKHATTAYIAIVAEGDQVQHFLNAQRVSSCEAAWSILGFKINSGSCSVERINVHAPDEKWVAFPENEDLDEESNVRAFAAEMSVSSQERYFARPATPEFDGLTLRQYFETYMLCAPSMLPARARAAHSLDMRAPPLQKAVYLRRVEQGGPPQMMVRLLQRSPRQGVVFYVRLLLNARLWRCDAAVCPTGGACQHNDACERTRSHDQQPRSYGDMKTGPTGTKHHTFEEAANDYNLLDGMDEYTVMFHEEVEAQRSPEQLQQLFVLCLTAEGDFAGNALWDKYRDVMSKGAYERCLRQNYPAGPATRARAHGVVLRAMAEHLTAMGKTLAAYELPDPVDDADVMSRYNEAHPQSAYAVEALAARRSPRQWISADRRWETRTELAMTAEQEPVFGAVLRRLRDNRDDPSTSRGLQMMVGARAGRGKTWLMRLIVAVARTEGTVVLCRSCGDAPP